MAFITDLFNKVMGNTMPVPQGVAMDRYTHTPIMPALDPDPRVAASYDPTARPLTTLPLSGLMSSGLNLVKPGVITTQPWMDNFPGTMHHEIVHAATVGDLDPSSRTYKTVQRLLPQQVQDEVPKLWSNFVGTPGFDPVHEGVARFLTSPDYSDKKWNSAKQKIVGAFPPATKAKLIRLLGQQE